MITGFFPTLLIIFIFLAIFGARAIRGRIAISHFICWMVFGLYIAILINVTFFPFPVQKMLIDISIQDHLGSKHNIIPFHDLWIGFKNGYVFVAATQLIKNILLFLPLGFLLPVLFSKISFKKIVVIGFIVSFTIEILQFLLGQFIGYNYRSFDIDDLIMNTLGTSCGLLLYFLGKRMISGEKWTLLNPH